MAEINNFLIDLNSNHDWRSGKSNPTSNEKENALSKLQSKNADAIVLNSLNDKDAGFGIDTNDVTIFHSNGTEVKTGIKSKKAVASDIVSFIIKHLHA